MLMPMPPASKRQRQRLARSSPDTVAGALDELQRISEARLTWEARADALALYLRTAGVSWARIGKALDLSPRGAMKRYDH